MLNLKKRFHPSKNEQNHYHEIEHLLTPKREDAQDSDLVHFLEDVIKVKNFLRLSHLYQRLWYNCTRYSLKLNSNFCFKRQNIWCLSISKFSRPLRLKFIKLCETLTTSVPFHLLLTKKATNLKFIYHGSQKFVRLIRVPGDGNYVSYRIQKKISLSWKKIKK